MIRGGCTVGGLKLWGILNSMLRDLHFRSSFLVVSEAKGYVADLGHTLVCFRKRIPMGGEFEGNWNH